MKDLTFIIMYLLGSIFWLYADIMSVTVDGYAYLENETEHSGIKVKFEATTPSAQTDSTYTDIDGYYSINLEEGAYKVYYNKDGFKPYTLPEEYLFNNNQTLPDVTLEVGEIIEVSGVVNGEWDPFYDYHVVGDIELQAGDTLLIKPGVWTKFMGDYQFTVQGVLIAQGTKHDSIYFTSGQWSIATGDWKNIQFNDITCNGSLMQYCIVEYGGSSDDCQLYINNTQVANIQILNSSIRFAKSTAIKTEYCYDLLFDSSKVYDNPQDGILCTYDSSTISNSIFHGNGWFGVELYGSAGTYIYSNKIYNNNWMGIRCDSHCDAIISHNLIHNNDDYGIYISSSSGHSVPIIEYNQIYENGCGIYNSGAYSEIIKNTIYRNSGDNSGEGIEITNKCDHTKIRNNIISSNDYGIRAGSEPEVIGYNDVYGNTQADFTGNGLPSYIGELVTTNTNGDSTDTYYNLCTDPELTDPENEDFSLQSSSPCIDAGDPETENDPDGTIADIGALFYDQSGSQIEHRKFKLNPDDYFLGQNYPNPFNPSTTISYQLPVPAFVQLDIYNIVGQKVAVLVDKKQPPGYYNVKWDTGDYPSGLYFYRLKAGSFIEQCKMLLVK